jgi:hypothetical protein
MFTLPSEVSGVLSPFQVLFKQQRSWHKAQQMLIGAILCRGKRTVSRVLETLGLAQCKQYSNYYRVLNRVGWSGVRWEVMQVLLPLPWSGRVWALPFLSVFRGC